MRMKAFISIKTGLALKIRIPSTVKKQFVPDR